MKILMPVLHYYPVIGGLETWTQNIAEGFSGKAEIFVVTGKVEKRPKKETLNGVKVFRTSLYNLRDLSFSSLFYIFTTLPFIFLKSLGLIKKEKINLLHCQGFLGGLLGYFLFKIQKVPYIVTVQKLEGGKGFLKRLAYQNAKTCIVASSAIKKYFEGIGVKDIRIIPNGINLNRFQNIDREESRKQLKLGDEFVIMTIGRLEWRKGFKYLIGAMNLLKEKLDEIDFRSMKLLIIGGGVLRGELEKLVYGLSLGEKVKFLGALPGQKIPEYLAACDCFVLTSLEEGFGIVILEAMASRVPVVGTKIGGILDIIKDRETGVLVESKNPGAIAEAIYEIYSRPEFAKNLVSEAARDLPQYEWQKIIERVEKIYLEFI